MPMSNQSREWTFTSLSWASQLQRKASLNLAQYSCISTHQLLLKTAVLKNLQHQYTPMRKFGGNENKYLTNGSYSVLFEFKFTFLIKA